MAAKPFVFVSYARADREPVSRIVDELRKLGITTWVDADQLVAGERWDHAIRDALKSAQALLFFISPHSASSGWVTSELVHALGRRIRVLPVLLEPTPADKIPLPLRRIQWLDATQYPPQTAPKSVANEIARLLNQWSTEGAPVVLREPERQELAKALAAQVKGETSKPDDTAPNSVFLVHGHDEELLQEVVGFLEALGIRAIVLKEAEGATRSLIDRFFELGGAARFAIVLLSADDMGASRIQFEEPDVGVKALKYRSRQNTVLELGYFYGLLGWDRVFVLERQAPRKFPDFERPSDLGGVVFDRYDAAGKWKAKVAQRLRSHGFVLTESKRSAPA